MTSILEQTQIRSAAADPDLCPVWPARPFNYFIAVAARHNVGINSEREAFFNFVSSDGDNLERSVPQWWTAWEAFCKQQDARDERETQLDALV